MPLVFALSNLVVMPFWLLMVFAPGWTWTRRVVGSPWIVLVPLVLYVGLVVPGLATLLPMMARPTLPAVAALLGTPEGATIAWVHFVAFDLFVGRWIFLDAREGGWRWPVTSPVLLLTLMLGPAGLLSYLVLRQGRAFVRGRTVPDDSTADATRPTPDAAATGHSRDTVTGPINWDSAGSWLGPRRSRDSVKSLP